MSHLGHHHQQHQQEQILLQQELEQWRQAAQAEYQRLYALPLADLAAEVMTRVFGPEGPGYDDSRITVAHESLSRGPTIQDISYLFVPDVDVDYRNGWSQQDTFLREQINKLIAEGLQQLEHASLVRCQIHYEMGTFDWAATRWGRVALDRGEVQAIVHGRR